MKKFVYNIKQSRAFYSIVGLAFLVILACIVAPNFASIDNMITILRQASLLLIMSSGLTFVLLTGGMDLSVGATAGLAGCICAQLIKADIGVPLAFLVGILVGAVIGLINGILSGLLPSFVATYGTNWVISGLGIVVMQGAVIYDLPQNFTNMGVGYVGPIPNLVIFAIIVVTLLYILQSKTTLGRHIYQVGANPVAARYSAVATKKVVLLAFILCGVCAAFAGMLMTARLNAADAAMGSAFGLQTLAAAVIGGTSQKGGEGGIIGTIVGALILTIVVNVMNLTGISSLAQGLVIGAVIIIMVLIDTIQRSRQEAKLN